MTIIWCIKRYRLSSKKVHKSKSLFIYESPQFIVFIIDIIHLHDYFFLLLLPLTPYNLDELTIKL